MGEWSASRPGRLTPRKRGWGGPRAGLDAVTKKNSFPAGKDPCKASHYTD